VHVAFDALRATGHEVEEDTVVGAVLAGLPGAYDTTVEIQESCRAPRSFTGRFGVGYCLCKALANRTTTRERIRTIMIWSTFDALEL
jgi:hypothetical protein